MINDETSLVKALDAGARLFAQCVSRRFVEAGSHEPFKDKPLGEVRVFERFNALFECDVQFALSCVKLAESTC